MRSLALAAAILAGCGTAPAPAAPRGCACDMRVCACPHHRPAPKLAAAPPRCACREAEKPR